MLFAQIVESVTIPVLLEEIKKASAGTHGESNVIYLFVVVLSLGGLGGFFVLRYMLSHAREIHTEANKTLLDITAKHELRCSSLTDTFSSECAELRKVILRIMSDARDMVHATRDIAGSVVTGKEFHERYAKAEAELKAKRDRDSPVDMK